MMNQRGAIGIVIGIIVAVVVVGGAAAWYYMRNQSGITGSPTPTLAPMAGTANPTQTPASAAGNFTGKIGDLIKQGQNLTCTFQRVDQAGTTNGTVYVAGQGQKLRGDFTVPQIEGTTMNGHIIRDEQSAYVWSDQLAQGTKFTITDEATPTPQAGTSAPQVLDENLTYSCQPWIVDASVFTIPANVQFVDISAQIQQLQATTNPVTSQ